MQSSDLQNFESRIVMFMGCGYDDLAEEIFPNSEFVEGEYPSDFAVAVRQHKADGMILGEAYYNFFHEEMSDMAIIGDSILDMDFAAIFAVEGTNDELYDEFNEFIEEITEDGTLAEINNKWLVECLSDADIDYSVLDESNPHILVGAASDEAPFTYTNGGKYIGNDAEIVVRFCEEYGYYPEFTEGDYNDMPIAIQTGKLDMGIAGYEIKEGVDALRYSQPLSQDHIRIIVQGEKKQTGFFESLKKSFYRTFIEDDRYKDFLSGISVTLIMTLGSIIIGTLLGVLFFMIHRDAPEWIRKIMEVISTCLTRIPTLVLLMVVYYIVFASVDISAVIVATIAFSIIFAFDTWGNMEDSISTISDSQKEAAFILGYGKNQGTFGIILPQARKLFLSNYRDSIVSILLESSTCSYIMIRDLTRAGDIVRNKIYEPFFPIITVAIIYLIIATVIIGGVNALEKSTDPQKRTREDVLKRLKKAGN